jgi:hypothetical protein
MRTALWKTLALGATIAGMGRGVRRAARRPGHTRGAGRLYRLAGRSPEGREPCDLAAGRESGIRRGSHSRCAVHHVGRRGGDGSDGSGESHVADAGGGRPARQARKDRRLRQQPCGDVVRPRSDCVGDASAVHAGPCGSWCARLSAGRGKRGLGPRAAADVHRGAGAGLRASSLR